MEALRKVENLTLNKGDLAARGLFNIYNEKSEDVTIWFDADKKNELMSLTDKENGLFGFLVKHKINPAGVRRTIKDFDSQSLPPPKPAKWGSYKWLN